MHPWNQAVVMMGKIRLYDPPGPYRPRSSAEQHIADSEWPRVGRKRSLQTDTVLVTILARGVTMAPSKPMSQDAPTRVQRVTVLFETRSCNMGTG